MTSRDKMDGIYGWADVPEKCPYCGGDWANGERVHTGDDAGIGGYEDWMYCGKCQSEVFFPVTHRPKSESAAISVQQ